MQKMAIVIVGYNRLFGIKRLLASIERAHYGDENVDLILDLDNCGKEDVVSFANAYRWKKGEKRVRTYESRQGLRNHMLKIGDWFDEYDALIVLEDDLVVSPAFFLYAKHAIETYSACERVFGISLYSRTNSWNGAPFLPVKNEYDTFFMQVTESWGQVWIKERWEEFAEWYEELGGIYPSSQNVPEEINKYPENTYSKYLTTFLVETDHYFVAPYIGFSSCFCDVGEHTMYLDYSGHTMIQVGEYKSINLAPFNEDAIKYDVFDDLVNAKKWLDISSEDITVDLAYYKNKPCLTKYLLTSKVLDYEIVRSFGLALRPIELNVLYNTEGQDIYLYNTEKPMKNHLKEDKYKKLVYRIGVDAETGTTIVTLFGGYIKRYIKRRFKREQ